MNGDDTDRVEDDVLRELVRDGARPAPAAARARVLSRLGVAAAAGTATLTGAATAAAVGKAATHSAAPAVGTALGAGLAKVLVAHPMIGIVATLAVGSVVGVGAYQAVEPARGPAPVVATAATPKPSSAQRASAATAPRSASSEFPAPVAPEPVVPLAEANANRATTAPSPAPARALPKREPRSEKDRVEVRTPTAELSPAPDLPAVRSARLSEQQTLLDQARASLRRGDGAGALAIVAGHESLYPVSEFAEERGAIRILSLVMTGAHDRAVRFAERFAKSYPQSLFLPSIRNALGDDSGRPNEPRAH